MVVSMTALVDQSSAKSKVEKMVVSITVLIIFNHIYLVAHPTNRKWVITPVINGISRVNPLIIGVN